MFELTEHQRQEVGDTGQPIRVIDPTSKREFFLVRAEVFIGMQTALSELNPRDTYSAIDSAFAPGWDDPKLADYDNKALRSSK